MRRARVLFLAEGVTLAHVARPLCLAEQLDPQQYEVLFATSDAFSQFVTTVPRIPLNSRTPDEFDTVLKRKGILFDEELLSSYVQEELEILQKFAPDVVVGDMRPSLAVSGPLSGVPVITLTNAYWTRDENQIGIPLPHSGVIGFFRRFPLVSHLLHSGLGTVFQRIAPRIMEAQGKGINLLRQKHGLSPFRDYLSGFIWGDRTLFCDPEILFPSLKLTPHERFLGPVSWSPPGEIPRELFERTHNRQSVFVSLGSSGDTSVLRALLHALDELGFFIILSTANRFENEEFTGSNISVSRFLPGEKIAPLVDLVVTNGGSPSSYQALAAGTPVLGIPRNMDQLLSMRSIERAGLGRSVRSDQVTSARVREEVERLLSDRALGERLEHFQRFLGLVSPSQIFEQALQELIFHRQEARRA